MEIWREVPGYEGLYEVSSEGRFRSLDRDVGDGRGGPRNRKGCEKAQSFDQDGYLQVRLCKGGKAKTWKAHRVVAAAFIPNPNGLPAVNHRDCNKQNNAVSNLEWCTGAQNQQHALQSGRFSPEKARNGKLKPDQAHEIRAAIATGRSCRSVAFAYGVKPAAVYHIRDGKTWWQLSERQ